MTLKAWRLVTIMLAALTVGMGFCHLMESPARLSWDQSLWVNSTVIGGLYRMFGTVGAVIDVGAVVTTIILAVKVRRRDRTVFRLTTGGAALFLLALVLWGLIVFPVNLELANWVSGPVPADWASYRLRWETGHIVNTLLMIVGLALLLWSVILETPEEAR